MKDTNYNIIQGDSWNIQLTYTDSSGSAINLTGYSVLMEVRDEPGGKILCASASVSTSASAGDGVTIDRANGKITILLSGTKTKKFNYPKSAYQIQITNGTNTYTLLKGWFIVDAGVIN